MASQKISRKAFVNVLAIVLVFVVACPCCTDALSIHRRRASSSLARMAGALQTNKPTSSSARPMSDAAAEAPRGGGGDVGEGTATIPNEVFNLVKSIVGAGVLSLPAGTVLSGRNV